VFFLAIVRHSRVRSDDIKDAGVKTVDIKDGQVTTAKIADKAITTDKLAGTVVTEAKALFLTQLGTIYTGSTTTSSYKAFPTPYSATPTILITRMTRAGTYTLQTANSSSGSFVVYGSPYSWYGWIAYGNK